MFTFPVTMMSSPSLVDGYDPKETYGLFDGTNDHVSLGTVADLAPPNISISAWINPSSYGNHANGLGRIIQHGTSYVLSLNKNFSGLGNNNLIFNNGTSWVVADDNSIALNQWQHIVISNDGSTITFYVNGISRGSDSGSHTITNSGSTCTIGSIHTGSGLYFNGGISDVRIYSDALTSSEVTYLYNLGLSGTDPGTANLVGRYKFDEGSGTTVGDSSGNGNDGTATNINEATFWNP